MTTLDIVAPWGDGGWRGLNVARNAEPGFEHPDYDDSAWPLVTLPLGGGAKSCPIHSLFPAATNWPANTDYLLRRTFNGSSFLLNFAVDNTATIYWDGISFGSFDNEDPGTGDTCPERDDHEPRSGALGPGAHVLAIRCADRGSETYFDCQLSISSGGWQIGRVGMG